MIRFFVVFKSDGTLGSRLLESENSSARWAKGPGLFESFIELTSTKGKIGT